jgi:hypothetical protein
MALNKNTTYTPKEALAADGRIPVKLGRGRMPAGGDAICRELAEAGYRIKGYQVSTSTPSTSTEVKSTKVVKKVAPGPATIAEYVIFWEEEEYKAVGVDKKVWSMRECCNTCMVSLVQCHCSNPTILGDIPVKIVRK